MKATCIVGSARSTGSTAYLIDTITRGMREAGAEVQKYCIGQANIRYCLGCKKCYTDGLFSTEIPLMGTPTPTGFCGQISRSRESQSLCVQASARRRTN